MPLVERRYAEAFVDLGSKNNELDQYMDEFGTVSDLFENHREFRLFLLNPELKGENKKSFIDAIFKEMNKTVKNFLFLLIDKGRIKELANIYKASVRLSDKKKNTVELTIVSSEELTQVQIAKLKDKYKVLYSATAVKENLVIDKKLIGGIKIIAGDKVIDGSIKARLEGLREILSK